MTNDTTKFVNSDDMAGRLRQERLRLGRNQKDFADLAGASLSTQTRYEKPGAEPDIGYLMKLKAHGVDVAYVLTGRSVGGDLFAIEQQLLDHFRRMDEAKKESLMLVAAALSAYQIPTAAEFVNKGRLHAPASEYRAEPKDD